MARDFDFHKYMLATLRMASYRFPERDKAKAQARVSRGVYVCRKCNVAMGPKEIALDHIKPVIEPGVGFVDWNTYIARLFVDVSGWQVLCKPCHHAKSVSENSLR